MVEVQWDEGDLAVDDARVVLLLRPSPGCREWPFLQLGELWSRAAFVVADSPGVPGDRQWWSEGMVLFNGEAPNFVELGRTILYYLLRPSERGRIARRGQELWQQSSMAEALRAPLAELSWRVGCGR